MTIPSFGAGAIVPACGFRWIYRGENDVWDAREPSADWLPVECGEEDLTENDSTSIDRAGRFYLAATPMECLKMQTDSEFGSMIDAPDLFLEFASMSGTPSEIFDLAHRYGLLRFGKSKINIPRDRAANIIDAFDWTPIDEDGDGDIYLHAEPASKWLQSISLHQTNIADWEPIRQEGNPYKMKGYLDGTYNYAMGGSLTFQVRLDPVTGQAHSDIIASSLADLLDVQWGMSIAADATHRQCQECPNWFTVHPGHGRPEKYFCSDACRMRAYRKRKSGKN